MNPENATKYQRLLDYLAGMGNLSIAFSGGVDSAFLLHAAREALGNRILALTVNSPYISGREIREAKTFAAERGIRHLVVPVSVPPQIRNNPEDRCYLCKSFLFKRLLETAWENGMPNLADGSNADDPQDHRPGMKALKELKILSPLLETGFSKKDIRNCSKDLGLPDWDKPAYACLLTRLPFHTRIDEETLGRIDQAETYLIGLGIRAVRVRTHGQLARIETEPGYMERISRPDLAKQITRQLQEYGYRHVTLDLGGYRTGGFNITKNNIENDGT